MVSFHRGTIWIIHMEQKLIILQRSRNKQNRCTCKIKSAPTPEYLPCAGEVSTRTPNWRQVTFPRGLLGWRLHDQGDRKRFPKACSSHGRGWNRTCGYCNGAPGNDHMSASETRVQILAPLLKDESMGNSSIPKHCSLRSDLAIYGGTSFLGLSWGLMEEIQGGTKMQFIEHHQDRILPKEVASRPFVRNMPEDMACSDLIFSRR